MNFFIQSGYFEQKWRFSRKRGYVKNGDFRKKIVNIFNKSGDFRKKVEIFKEKWIFSSKVDIFKKSGDFQKNHEF